MHNNELSGVSEAFRRTTRKVIRRLIGFILLAVAIGLSTCQALDGVRQPVDPVQIERIGE